MRTPDPKYALLAAQLAKSHAEAEARIAKDDEDHKRLYRAQDGNCALCHDSAATVRAYNRDGKIDSLQCHHCAQAVSMGEARLSLAMDYIKARRTAPYT